jgi:ATP-dependent helicase/nuclease subunit A
VSFRSTQETLSAVDRIFKGDGAQGLSFGDAADVAHESTRREADDIGFVELWPLIGKLEGPAIDDALAPAADGEAPEAEPDPPNARLAARVARHVRLLIENGDPCGRSVTPGDVMILVRRRGPLFEALIAALKAAGVAVAGADRLRVADHIAVRDCLALARAALAPDDDYALACLLKSPLVGLDDSHLMAFAPERPGRLLDALATAAPSDPALAEAKTKLGRWRARAGDGPFAFFGRILEAEGGRLALTVRLGAEAGDALDEFLARALDFERTESGSLSTFVAAFEESAIAVKRDLDQAANEVRVMTVHAAKGLEAPIVILPDTTAKPEGKEAPPVLRAALPGGGALAVWSTAGARPAPIAAAQAQAAADAADENRRLLYVALTRARNGLIIAGAHGRAPPPGCWFLQITEALDEGDVATGGTLVPFAARDGEGVSRFWTLPGRPLRAPGRSAGAPSTPAPPPPPPDWATAPAPPETPQEPPLSPSRAAEAADRRDRPFDRPGAADARARGRLVHRLLESLPTLAPAARPVAARALAERAGVHLPAEARADLATRALALVENPALALLFGPDSRAEVAVAGRVTLPGGRAVAVGGAIDRLAATATDVLIGDYKTSARPPRAGAPIPARILAQLALYRALVQPLYPGRRVRCLVIWTAGPTVQEAPTEALDAALAGL